MQPYTLAQKAKAVVAAVASFLTAVASLAGYVAAQEFVSAEYRAWATVVAGIATAASAACGTYIATFKVPNAPTEDAPAPADVHGSH